MSLDQSLRSGVIVRFAKRTPFCIEMRLAERERAEDQRERKSILFGEWYVRLFVKSNQ
jgi:hypothetical protein